jgi:hypothetical protein
MPHFYSTTGEKVSLTLSTDDVGVRFAGEAGPETARRAMTTAAAPRGRRADASRFGRYLMVHEAGAVAAPVGTLINALPRRLALKASSMLPVYVEEESGLRLVAGEEITVRFKARAAESQRRRLLDGLGLEVKRPSEFGPHQVVVMAKVLRSGSRALDLANLLREADDIVDYAAPNFLSEFKKQAAPDDPMFDDQWHLANTGQRGALAGEDVRALDAWRLTRGGSPRLVIAILDDGVDIGHPDLQGNIWRNPRSSAPDRHGRDFVDDEDPYNPIPKVFTAPFDDTDLNDIHGTPCAGVAAAVGDNRKGVAGIAYRCRILPVKIFAASNLAPNDRIADAIRYAGLHADVLSCSWTAPRHPDIESAINDVVRTGRKGKGCAVFAATGNDRRSSIGFPSRHPRAFAVGASTSRGRRPRYSNYGEGLAFLAPSDDDDGRVGITTTDVSNRGKGYAPGSAYCHDFGGTSSATPLAAGIAALILSVNADLTWEQVGDILKRTADKIGGAQARYRRGYSTEYGHGRVNAAAAVEAAKAKAKTKTKKR